MSIEIRQFVFSNFARSTLANDIGASDTEINIQPDDAAKFPDPTYTELGLDEIFPVILHDASGNFEVVYCTGREDAVLTVERAKEGTTALAFSAGTTVIHNVTKGFLLQQTAAPSAPTAPTLSGELDGTTYTLTWTASTAGSGDALIAYRIYRSTGSGFTLLATVDDLVLTYDDEGLDLSNTYTYYVVGLAAIAGEGAQSNQVQTTSPYILGVAADLITRSFDGESFTTWQGLPNYNESWTSIAYSPSLDRYVVGNGAFGDSVGFAYSDDGALTWTKVNKPGGKTASIYRVIWVEELSLFIAGFGTNTAADTEVIFTSPDGITWTIRNAPNARLRVLDICYSAGLGAVFATCYNQATARMDLITSTDGITWTLVAAASDVYSGSSNAQSIVAADGHDGKTGLVVMGGSTRLISYDGTTVTNHGSILPTGGIYGQHGLAYSPTLDVFVVVNTAGQPCYGSDLGVTFTGIKDQSGSAIGDIGNGRAIEWHPGRAVFTTAGFNGVYVSSNGENWSLIEDPGEIRGWTEARALTPSRRMVAIGDTAPADIGEEATAWSPNGFQWYIDYANRGANAEAMYGMAVRPSDELTVAVGDNGRILTSTDRGATWTERTSGTTKPIRDVAYSPSLGLFVAVCYVVDTAEDKILTSPDGITWTVRNTGFTGVTHWFYSIDWSPTLEIFAAVGRTGAGNLTWATSPDGITWTAVAGSATGDLFKVKWVHDRFFASRLLSTVAQYTTDGVNVSATTGVQSSGFYDFVYLPSSGLYLGIGAFASSSSDGVSWTSLGVVSLAQLSVDYSEALGVAVGWTGTRGVQITDANPPVFTQQVSDLAAPLGVAGEPTYCWALYE